MAEYYTYVLLSKANGDLYVGSTENLENGIKLHNKGRVKSTKAHRPWKLVKKYVFSSRAKAVHMERHLKTGQQKELLHKRLGLVHNKVAAT